MESDFYRSLIDLWFNDVYSRGDPFVFQQIPDQFKKRLEEYRVAFTDAEWQIHDVLLDGDKAAVRYSGQVTYSGGYLDIPAQDQRVTEMGILVFRFRDGKICELWSAMNNLELVLELGAIPVVPAKKRRA
jgi:predicted ester cyclase